MSNSELVPIGWHSRRHETSEAHHTSRDRYGTHAQRQERRRAAALRRREWQLAQYMLEVFDRAAGYTFNTFDPAATIERAQTEVNNLRAKLNISV